MANFRPVSNLSFVSKVVEKVISRQLNEHLTDQGLLPRHQSAYRKYHSTETAMLRVMSDAFTATDQRHVTMTGLLDLSSVFDCVDHSLLPQRLECTFGLSGTVLCWLMSYIANRSQHVAYCGQLSPTQSLRFRAPPQGSVLVPLLFVLYTADLSRVVSYISMRMTLKSTSARQSMMRRLRLTVFPSVSMMSRPGSAQVDWD